METKKGVIATSVYAEGHVQNELVALVEKHSIDVLILGRQEYTKSNVPYELT